MARHSQYPQIKVDEALLAYYTLGTLQKASEASGVPATTIYDWATTSHKARYDELAEKYGPTLERQVVAKLARTADKATDRIDMGLDAMEALIIDGNLKDANLASGAAKNAALVLGIVTDKKLTLEGRPTVITEHRDADDIIRSLSALGVIDSTATEIPTQQPTLEPAASTPDLGAQRSQTEPKRAEPLPA